VNSAKGTCVFLVRMWQHGGEPEAGGSWRGSIQDVESGRIFYLADTRDVAEFIDARLSERTKTGFESSGDSE